jgi:hypothetical protein
MAQYLILTGCRQSSAQNLFKKILTDYDGKANGVSDDVDSNIE